ncbi:MAG: 50S ribosomal protein L3 N(5)-glutamine methyltransferase [Magnetococcales bacterium]|nr:50S ribosomal protein L3 N(5)-glutamine methyltransferase [Magnetococcales bacterium]
MKKDKNTNRYNNPPPFLAGRSKPATIGEWITLVADNLQTEEICLENGSQEPYLEAEYLICYAFSIAFNEIEQRLDQPPPDDAANRVAPIWDNRINKRLPAAYITQEAFFAGERFFVDERVLIPRSRFENIFDDEEGFDALLETGQVSHILDLCTGSGCLAIILARTFPHAQVDGADISPLALQVAQINRDHFKLGSQLQLIESDLFQGLSGKTYDLIVTNPPYVSTQTMDTLPPEYRHEPALALAAGAQGLDLIIPLLQQAVDHLKPGGLLLCEVGDETQEIMETCWPDFPGDWLLFHFGGSGLFAIDREQLSQWLTVRGSLDHPKTAPSPSKDL